MENSLILNRDFTMPTDGYYHIAPFGEFPNAAAGLVQVIDRAACDAMAARFNQDSKVANFAGVLVDFDHSSLDTGRSSEASGWVTGLQVRETGLFANIRWSDTGEAAVKGGRFRFVSPVWARSDCADLGGGRVRPMRLLNLAVTNDPNLKGMVPLSNRGQNAECGTRGVERGMRNAERGTENGDQKAAGGIRNAAAAAVDDEKRFKWVMGDVPSGVHCAVCLAATGQVHTKGEWVAAGLEIPGHPNCACSLEETNEPSTGAVVGIPPRHDGVNVGAVVPAPRAVRNVGWTEQARAVSLAVRKAKAAARGGVPAAGTAGPAPTKPGVTIHTPPIIGPLPVPKPPIKTLPKPGTGGTTTLPVFGGGPPIKIGTPGPQPMPVVGSPEWLSGQMFLFQHVQFQAFLDSALTQLVLFLTQKQHTGQGLDAQETAFMSQAPAELARRRIVIKYPPVGIFGKPVPGSPPTKPIVRRDTSGHVPGSPGSANPGIQMGNRNGEPDADAIANVGWTDAARAASLAVRKARAATRVHSGVADRAAASKSPVVPAAVGVPPGGAAVAGVGDGGQPETPMEQFQREGVVAMDDQDIQTLYGEIAAKKKNKQPLDAMETAFLKAAVREGLRRAIARKRAKKASEPPKSNP